MSLTPSKGVITNLDIKITEDNQMTGNRESEQSGLTLKSEVTDRDEFDRGLRKRELDENLVDIGTNSKGGKADMITGSTNTNTSNWEKSRGRREDGHAMLRNMLGKKDYVVMPEIQHFNKTSRSYARIPKGHRSTKSDSLLICGYNDDPASNPGVKKVKNFEKMHGSLLNRYLSRKNPPIALMEIQTGAEFNKKVLLHPKINTCASLYKT